MAADTARILASIASTRASRTPTDRQAAARLNRLGDAAYRRRDYPAAFEAYSNSYPNDPNPRAYILAGDSHWRAVLAHLDARPSAPDCGLNNEHFPRDLALDLARHQDVGLALAGRGNDRRVARSSFYRRARDEAACLRALAADQAALPPSACVDLDRLRACLGAPLFD